MAHVPKVAMRAGVAADLRRVFDADDVVGANRRLHDLAARYRTTAPSLVAWLEENIPEASPSCRSLPLTDDGSERPTDSSTATKRSNAEPGSPRSSHTRKQRADVNDQ